MEALEAELETTRQEHQRLSEVSAKCAVQEKISDLLEDQLQCTICSELMIKVSLYLSERCRYFVVVCLYLTDV